MARKPTSLTRTPAAKVHRMITVIRDQKVLLDSDLARLYGVPTRALIQAVQRNIKRFPHDFMFQLDPAEAAALTAATKGQHGGRRSFPYAFTEQGVAMLSSVLRSPRAVRVNIEIMRAFVRLRELLATHKDLLVKLARLEAKYDDQFRMVFEAIRALMDPPEVDEPKKPPIGFRA